MNEKYRRREGNYHTRPASCFTRLPANYHRTGLEDHFLLEQKNIPPGEIVGFTTLDCPSSYWPFVGRHFYARSIVYAGAPSLWMLSASVQAQPVIPCRIPMDAYRIGGAHWLDWLPFGPIPGTEMKFEIKNEGQEAGDFVALLAGEATSVPL